MPIKVHCRVYRCPRCGHEQRLYNQSDVAFNLSCKVCGSDEMLIVANERPAIHGVSEVLKTLIKIPKK